MKILALEKEAPGLTSAQFKPFLKAEAARAWELQQAGVIRELYFRPDEHTADKLIETSPTEPTAP